MSDVVIRLGYFVEGDILGIERKLEKMAAKGLFIETIGPIFWTYKKAKPKQLKYTITYFKEGSIYNCKATDNQKIYFEFGESIGWQFVCEFNQLQVFCSDDINCMSFETDEYEKFMNIKKCTKKSYLKDEVIKVVLWIILFAMQLSSFQNNLIDNLASLPYVLGISCFVIAISLSLFKIIDYFWWCKKASKEISIGNECPPMISDFSKSINIGFRNILLIVCFYCIIAIIGESNNLNVGLLSFSIIGPLLIFVVARKFFKYKGYSAKTNKILSFVILIGFTIVGTQMINISNTTNIIYDIETMQSADYTYEKDESFLLTYYQYSNNVSDIDIPIIDYQIIKPKFNLIYDICVNDLLYKNDWYDIKQKEIKGFNANKSYEIYVGSSARFIGYVILYDDKIVNIETEQKLSEEQILIVYDKLNLN